MALVVLAECVVVRVVVVAFHQHLPSLEIDFEHIQILLDHHNPRKHTHLHHTPQTPQILHLTHLLEFPTIAQMEGLNIENPLGSMV